MNDRLALLRAILASPAEDTPRLAFADWLDEHGTSDADVARAEFIRLGCKMKNGRPAIQKAESEWIRANWKRLYPALVATIGEFPIKEKWKGRYLEMNTMGEGGWSHRGSWVIFEFRRGFAARIRFKRLAAYKRLREAIASDDPVTTIGPYEHLPFGGLPRGRFVFVHPHTWGEDVFARVTGFDKMIGAGKRFDTTPNRESWQVQDAARDALTVAMTAIAREANGLAEPKLSEPA